jgi:hypothetical protein
MTALRAPRALVAALVAAAGCSGPLVNVAPVPPAAYSEGGTARGEACGMLLFGFIPISVNDRVERAYQQALAEARATSLTATSLTERWYFTPIGPGLCTALEGTPLVRSAGAAAVPTAPRAEFRELRKDR